MTTATTNLAKEFILAGDAIFTVELPPTGPESERGHYTFRVQHVPASDRWAEAYFVKLLVGADEYAYLGKLHAATAWVQATAKSCQKADSYVVRLLNRILARVWADDHQAFEAHGFRLHHEGKCGVCGRPLTTPESIERGIGPICAEKMMADSF